MIITIYCNRNLGDAIKDKALTLGATLLPEQIRNTDIIMMRCKAEQKDVIEKIEGVELVLWRDEIGDEFKVCPKCGYKGGAS